MKIRKRMLPMKIRKVNDENLICVLPIDELGENGLCVEDIMNNEELIEKIVSGVVSIAHEKLELDLSSKNLWFDFYDVEDAIEVDIRIYEEDVDMGSEFLSNLLLNRLSIYADMMSPGPDTADDYENDGPVSIRTIAFKKIDDAIKCCKVLAGYYDGDSAFYKTRDDMYILCIDSRMYELEEFVNICNTVLEYGKQSAVSIEYLLVLEEHGLCIINDHAIEKLASL